MEIKYKIKFKFNYKKLIHYYFLFLIILGTAIYAYLFWFLNDHVLNAMSFTNSANNTVPPNIDKSNDINLNSFNTVMEQMDEKTKPRTIKNFKEIF